MIAPHVHFRDWNESHKETIAHGLSVAERAGLSAVFDMPNTNPAITTRELVEKRLKLADEAKSPVFYGLFVGLTSDENQIKEAIKIHHDFFPRVVGFKLYAGESVGTLAVTEEEDQKRIYEILAGEGFSGVVDVHCERKSLMYPGIWDPKKPKTHCLARPPWAEAKSVYDQILFADDAKYKGRLNFVHLSVPRSVEYVIDGKVKLGLKLSCAVTPHHLLLDSSVMENQNQEINPLLYKVNPPLRESSDRKDLIGYLRQGWIDFIEPDHAPHTLDEKLGIEIDKKENPMYMSGFPVIPFYPHFIRYLRKEGFSEEAIRRLTHDNICKIFGMDIPNIEKEPDFNLHEEYSVDVFKNLRELCK